MPPPGVTLKPLTPPRTGYDNTPASGHYRNPNWAPAQDIIARLREMPAVTAEAEVEVRLYNILGFLFPGLRYPEIATRYPSGDGPIGYFQHVLVI